jgi:hypothetical protein
LNCRNCGGPVAAERAELGYDYCTKPECVAACLKRLNVVAVHVNKASDQYMLREQLGLPEHRSTVSVEPGLPALHGRTERSRRHVRPRSTVEKIDALEAELDAALAVETDPERRNKLVNDYNAKLRQFDIRYRRIRQRHEPSRG